MTWSAYGVYLVVAVVVVIAPGPDFALTVKNALAGGSRGGPGTAFGIATRNVVQGSAAALGLGALIMRSQPVFEAIRWAGVCYLLYLGVQALRSAARGEYSAAPEAAGTRVRGVRALLSLMWLSLVVVFLGRLRPWLVRRTVRRVLDAFVGCALIGFGIRLAFDPK